MDWFCVCLLCNRWSQCTWVEMREEMCKWELRQCRTRRFTLASFSTCQTISQKAVYYFTTTLTQTINNVKLVRQQISEKKSKTYWAPAKVDSRALAYIEHSRVHQAGLGLMNKSTWQISPPFLLICKLSS